MCRSATPCWCLTSPTVSGALSPLLLSRRGADTFTAGLQRMSFKQLLRGGSPGDQKRRVTPERVAPSDAVRTPAGARSAGGRGTAVLYVGEPRETRLISGAFTYDYPQLAVDLSSDL